MNILPKKRWHVRTKDNIARVRKDEALAAEEEKKRQARIQIAEREARIEALHKKAKQQYGAHISIESTKIPEPESSRHVNLFYELEQNQVISNKTNEEYEKEKKLEKEKYEKQIGYLTYLGQDTNEITGQVSWYNKPKRDIVKESEEVSKKQKMFEDPLEDMKKYLGFNGSKKMNESVKPEKKEIQPFINKEKQTDSKSSSEHKKHKKDKKSKNKKKKKKDRRKYSSESEELVVKKIKKKENVDLKRLRAERLKREREERKRADEVFAKLNGVTVKRDENKPETSCRDIPLSEGLFDVNSDSGVVWVGSHCHRPRDGVDQCPSTGLKGLATDTNWRFFNNNRSAKNNNNSGNYKLK